MVLVPMSIPIMGISLSMPPCWRMTNVNPGSPGCWPRTRLSSCRSTPISVLLIAADDVLHAWAVPAFGVKLDAVPGRLNETWLRVEKEGTYYGQCSELCGHGPRLYADHGQGGLEDSFSPAGSKRPRRNMPPGMTGPGVKLAAAGGAAGE